MVYRLADTNPKNAGKGREIMYLCPFCSRELITDNYSCTCGAMNISCAREADKGAYPHKVITAPIVGMKGRHRIVRVMKPKPVGSMVRITAHKTERGSVYLKKSWKITKTVEE